jgi:hypothetical protein
MRVEATIPESRGSAVAELAEELGLSRSQIVDEALALFLKAVIEVRRGRRLLMVGPGPSAPSCEIATPTLSALEWAGEPRRVELPARAVARMRAAGRTPRKANARLRAAAKRHAAR